MQLGHVAAFRRAEARRSGTRIFDNLSVNHFGFGNIDPAFVHAVTARNAAGIFHHFDFFAELTLNRIHLPLHVDQGIALSLQFFRRQALGQLVFKTREIAEIVDRIGKRAFDQHDFAVIFAVFDFAVADALAFP